MINVDLGNDGCLCNGGWLARGAARVTPKTQFPTRDGCVGGEGIAAGPKTSVVPTAAVPGIEAKRLGRSKTGQPRSLRKIAAELAKIGETLVATGMPAAKEAVRAYFRAQRQTYSAKIVRAMLAQRLPGEQDGRRAGNHPRTTSCLTDAGCRPSTTLRALAAASPLLTPSRIDPRLGRRVGLCKNPSCNHAAEPL
jgi:hypothetical protein